MGRKLKISFLFALLYEERSLPSALDNLNSYSDNCLNKLKKTHSFIKLASVASNKLALREENKILLIKIPLDYNKKLSRLRDKTP